jgi:hypothetical protein
MTGNIMKRLMILFGIISLTAFSMAQAPRNYLSGRFTPDQLNSLLIPQQNWHPYPNLNDHELRAVISEDIRNQYIKKAETFLGKNWEILPATVLLDFAKNGNRSRYENIMFGRRQRLTCLILAEIFENKGRFTNDIANGVWAICEETFWGVPAHLGTQRRGVGLPDVTEPTIDLFAAETGELLAWAYYLLGDKLDLVSPLIKERIYLEEDRRIISSFLERTDYWWMGFNAERSVNNWNPWINSNVLNIVLLLEKNETRRAQAVYKSMQSIDIFINSYPDDGGCDEGPGYWSRAGGSLFDYLELLYLATDGKISIFNEPLVQKMGQFIYKAWIHDDYYIDFADASAINQPEAGLVYRFGKRINDPMMKGFGAYLALRQKNGRSNADPDDGSLIRVIPDLLATNEMIAEKPVEPYLADFWLPGLQVMAARSYPDSEKDIYVAAKGGHNAESHNHNDVGNFIVYADGRPLLIDIGVETYTAKTFSSNRYDIWTMQSQYHNLPTINGIQQKDGREYRAENARFTANAKQVKFSLDLAKTYPADAMVTSWNREIILDRGRKLTLSEKYELQSWKEPVKLNLMTAFKTDVSVPGQVILTDKQDPSRIYEMTYDPEKFNVVAESKEVTDGRLMPVWGNSLVRLVFTAKDKSLAGKYQVVMKRKSK